MADDSEVEEILVALFEKAKKGCGNPMDTDNVKKWWFAHYRGNFYYAIHHKKKKYEEAAEQLLMKADDLGKTARKIAGDGALVTPLHACLASFQVDCPVSVIREDWCN
jgi:hypothetical protein